MGLVPTKGLTLPFLSYGRSSVLASCLALGVLLGIGRREGRAGAPRDRERHAERGRAVTSAPADADRGAAALGDRRRRHGRPRDAGARPRPGGARRAATPASSSGRSAGSRPASCPRPASSCVAARAAQPLRRAQRARARVRGALAALGAARSAPRARCARFRADFVLSVGGYAAVPVTLAALLLARARFAVVEANATPGRARTALVARRSRRASSSSSRRRGARSPAGPRDPRVSVTRRSRCGASWSPRSRGAPAARRPAPPFRVFVFGGSQGARQINDALLAIAAAPRPGALRVRPPDRREPTASASPPATPRAGVHGEVVAFERDMARALPLGRPRRLPRGRDDPRRARARRRARRCSCRYPHGRRRAAARTRASASGAGAAARDPDPTRDTGEALGRGARDARAPTRRGSRRWAPPRGAARAARRRRPHHGRVPRAPRAGAGGPPMTRCSRRVRRVHFVGHRRRRHVRPRRDARTTSAAA